MHLFSQIYFLNKTEFYSKNKYENLMRLVGFIGTAVAQWLRCCATNLKAAGSIADGVIGIFHWHNPSDRTMALGSNQPLNRNEYEEYFLGVKAAGA